MTKLVKALELGHVRQIMQLALMGFRVLMSKLVKIWDLRYAGEIHKQQLQSLCSLNVKIGIFCS